MNTKTLKPEKKRKRTPGRPYVPRPCVLCESEATITFQVRTRPLGPGSFNRKMHYSPSILLCDRCSRSRDYGNELVEVAAAFMQKRPRRNIPRGPGLFAVAESAIQ